ncbi:MAG: cobalamin biosynthesis protein [Dysosmobacter welbionis]
MTDAANYLPARTAALFWIAGAGLTGRCRQAFRIWRRDRRCHASPNSAQTESACAGALGISWRDLPGISGSGMKADHRGCAASASGGHPPGGPHHGLCRRAAAGGVRGHPRGGQPGRI